MNVMAMADVPFGDSTAWQSFLFDHAQQHKRIAEAVLQITGRQISTTVFADEADLRAWLLQNNRAHAEEIQATGISGFALPDVDLRDNRAYNDWMAQHALLHRIINNALGL